MDHAFWHERWRDGRIAFHEGQPNALLSRHAGELPAKSRVLVPLCGKAADLAYLAALGHEVVGVELVESAVRGFFAERGLTPVESTVGALRRFEADGVVLLAGDFFAVTTADVGRIDAFYDRAAIIALPPDLRPAYVRHLRGLLAPAAVGVVITLQYDQTRMDGPPFAVGEAELRAHFAGAQVELLHERVAGGRAAEVGAIERCWRVRG